MTVTQGWTQHDYARWLAQTLTSLIDPAAALHDGTSRPAL